MNIYKHEIDAGLGELIKNNALAYCSDIVVAEDVQQLPKAIAKIKDNIDLFPFESVLASTGWNGNDDVFIPEELWKAKDTAANKKVNYMHEETEIVGVITASLAVADGKILDKPTDNFDVVTSSYLYKIWEKPELQERMNNIIQAIARGEWFVSMECLFKHFDYALIKGEENFWIPRNEETSHLTKHLRMYGGTGIYQGYRIGRLLRDFTFSGVGLVENPANKRSVILNSFKAQAELIMENKNYEELLAKAEAKIEKLQDDLQSKVEAAAKAEKDKLIKEIEKLNLTIAEEKEAKEKAEKIVSEKEVEIENLAKASKNTSDELAKVKTELDKVNTELSKAAAEKKVAERRSQLVSAGIEKVEEILSTWASATDEQFAQVVELAKKTVASTEKETVDLATAAVVENDNIPNVPESQERPEIAKAAQDFLVNLFSKKQG